MIYSLLALASVLNVLACGDKLPGSTLRQGTESDISVLRRVLLQKKGSKGGMDSMGSMGSIGSMGSMGSMSSMGSMDSMGGTMDGEEKEEETKTTAPPSSGSKTFTYDDGPFGPKNWGKINPQCAGKYQSPVQIDMSKTVAGNYKPLNFSGYTDLISSTDVNSAVASNLVVVFNFPPGKEWKIKGGPLGDTEYTLHSLHYHWDDSGVTGSEHTFLKNGTEVTFPLEGHFVHYRSDLPSLGAALDKNIFQNEPQGLAVLGLFFSVDEEADSAWGDFIEMATGSPFSPPSTVALKAAFQAAFKNYVTYSGSLTTPPCSESVQFILSTNEQKISPYKMKGFRNDIIEEIIVNAEAGSNIEVQVKHNFRPTQPLNGRVITKMDQ